MSEFSQGICHDGAAILKDGEKMTIEEILKALRAGYRDSTGFRAMCEAFQRLEEIVGIDTGGWNGPGPALNAVERIISERDALAANLDELRKAGEAIRHELAQWALTERDPETSSAMCQFDHVARESPTTSLARREAEVFEGLVPRVADEIGRTLDLSEDEIIEVEDWLGGHAELRRQAEERAE